MSATSLLHAHWPIQHNSTDNIAACDGATTEYSPSTQG